ncbi:uncharacterized protein LOC143252251 isoform X3 [Tachypleus tridentatus]|uniref:uncharacterized protein LOC143252251 isoform X3 n=1 Tax=Tachypleus tridentatus TaxID=6853 RepID=UPI003FD41E09
MLKSKVSHLTFHRYFGQYNLQNESTQQPMKAGFESSRRQYLNMTGQRTLCTTCFVYIVNSEWSIHQFDSVSCLWWPFLALSLKYRMKSKFIINYLDNSRTELMKQMKDERYSLKQNILNHQWIQVSLIRFSQFLIFAHLTGRFLFKCFSFML